MMGQGARHKRERQNNASAKAKIKPRGLGGSSAMKAENTDSGIKFDEQFEHDIEKEFKEVANLTRILHLGDQKPEEPHKTVDEMSEDELNEQIDNLDLDALELDFSQDYEQALEKLPSKPISPELYDNFNRIGKMLGVDLKLGQPNEEEQTTEKKTKSPTTEKDFIDQLENLDLDMFNLGNLDNESQVHEEKSANASPSLATPQEIKARLEQKKAELIAKKASQPPQESPSNKAHDETKTPTPTPKPLSGEEYQALLNNKEQLRAEIDKLSAKAQVFKTMIKQQELENLEDKERQHYKAMGSKTGSLLGLLYTFDQDAANAFAKEYGEGDIHLKLVPKSDPERQALDNFKEFILPTLDTNLLAMAEHIAKTFNATDKEQELLKQRLSELKIIFSTEKVESPESRENPFASYNPGLNTITFSPLFTSMIGKGNQADQKAIKKMMSQMFVHELGHAIQDALIYQQDPSENRNYYMSEAGTELMSQALSWTPQRNEHPNLMYLDMILASTTKAIKPSIPKDLLATAKEVLPDDFIVHQLEYAIEDRAGKDISLQEAIRNTLEVSFGLHDKSMVENDTYTPELQDGIVHPMPSANTIRALEQKLALLSQTTKERGRQKEDAEKASALFKEATELLLQTIKFRPEINSDIVVAQTRLILDEYNIQTSPDKTNWAKQKLTQWERQGKKQLQNQKAAISKIATIMREAAALTSQIPHS